jgi:hypothetical protein
MTPAEERRERIERAAALMLAARRPETSAGFSIRTEVSYAVDMARELVRQIDVLQL